MKQFDLKEYLANPGKKVVTRDGCDVEIISTNGRGPYSIVGYINDDDFLVSWCNNGHYVTDDETTHQSDLFFADEESDDERIRKDIIAFLQSMNSHCNPNQDWDLRNRWLPYLEKQKEQNPAEWSEEDEEMRKLLIAILEVNHPNGFFKANEINTLDMRGIHTSELIVWLKSLRPRPHWKPSAKQMDSLRDTIVQTKGYTYSMYLPELYEQLKKLM